jgi:curved DNA-binding protein CbpA
MICSGLSHTMMLKGLRTAFRQAVKGAHPDIRPGDPDAALRQIVLAQKILADAEQRGAYEHLLELARLEPESASEHTIAARITIPTARAAAQDLSREEKGRLDHEPEAICDSGGGAVRIGRSRGLGRRSFAGLGSVGNAGASTNE